MNHKSRHERVAYIIGWAVFKNERKCGMSQIPSHVQKAVTGDGPASTSPNLEPWFSDSSLPQSRRETHDHI